jgi:hypothetical protein
MCRGERYACKNSECGMSYSGGILDGARMYLDKRYIIFKFANLRYLMNMLNLVQVPVDKCTQACDDVMSCRLCTRSYRVRSTLSPKYK